MINFLMLYSPVLYLLQMFVCFLWFVFGFKTRNLCSIVKKTKDGTWFQSFV